MMWAGLAVVRGCMWCLTPDAIGGDVGSRAVRRTFTTSGASLVREHLASAATSWAQIDTVHITKDFLDDPSGFLDELLADDTD